MSTTFEAGTSFSHYRVIAPLGAGGMGEVYKAHDLTLERAVALKILPPELVRNDERVRRFVQEARSASSLNHPNIVTIHEIGQATVSSTEGGANATPLHYIAMELIDGATMRRKIYQDDTDLRTLLGYLSQAAEGLAKAHAAGIVHRDLKPENIMVTRDGYAKVLDFGLAKLSVKKSSDSASEATVARHDTREGALLGTVGYMSPEQVQGKPVDHRSDIFSFGSILYEAATRQRPFAADSDVDVMHKILHDKPVPIDQINPQVPAELRRLIRRCMAKDPDKRYQSMKDLALELSEIVDEFEELSASATSASGSVPSGVREVPRPRRMVAVLAAAALIAAVAIASAIYVWRQSRTRTSGATAFGSMQVTRVTSSGNVTDAAISPDGKYVAYVLRDSSGHWVASVRQIATGTEVPVLPPSPTPIERLTYSRDGNYLYFTRRDQESGIFYSSLYRVAALGGPPRKLLYDVDTTVSFSPDGKHIAFGRGILESAANALVVADADGGEQRELLRTGRLSTNPTAPAWTPDGTKVITAVRKTQGFNMDLVAVDVASGKTMKIGSTPWREIPRVAVLPDGSAVLMVALQNDGFKPPQIWLQPYPEGQAVHVTNDVNAYGSISLDASGKTLAAIISTSDAQLMIGDPSDENGGKLLNAATTDQRPTYVSVASNGSVVYSFAHGDSHDIAIIDSTGAAPRVLTSDGASAYPSISGDGKTIAFQSLRTGEPSVFIMDADGGNSRRLTASFGAHLTRDGRTVFFTTGDGTLWKIAAAGGTPQKIAERIAAFSTDPSSTRIAVAYLKQDGGAIRSFTRIMPLNGGNPLSEFPTPAGAAYPNWRPGDDALTFVRTTGGVSNLFLQPLDGSPAKQLTHFRKGIITAYDWTADGKLVMARGERHSDLVLISNFH